MNAVAKIVSFLTEAEDDDFDLKDLTEPTPMQGGPATVKRHGRFKVVETPRFTFLISYLTPVAYYDKVTETYYETSKKWSPTTNKHISDWKQMIYKSPEWQANPENKEPSTWDPTGFSVGYPRFKRKLQAFISKLFRDTIPHLEMKPNEKRRMYHVNPKMRQGSGLSKSWLSGHLKHHDSGEEGMPRPDERGYEEFFKDFEPHEPEIYDWSSGLRNNDPRERGEDPLGEASVDERASTGIYLKQLDNGRKVFSSRCDCGVIHGGYESYEEAAANKKCRRCYRGEIEKTRKEIEKVDEPRKQKDIFQNRMNKPAVLGESYEDDDFKEMSEPAPDISLYRLISQGRDFYTVTREGKIGRFHRTADQMNGMWMIEGMTVQPPGAKIPTFLPWPKMRIILNNGETLEGIVREKKIMGPRYRREVSKEWPDVYKISKVDNAGIRENFSAVDSGEVTREVCVSARYNQEFWFRDVRNADGAATRVRVCENCQTWKTRPDEFKLPVKYGHGQSFYITHANAGEFTTVEPPVKRKS